MEHVIINIRMKACAETRRNGGKSPHDTRKLRMEAVRIVRKIKTVIEKLGKEGRWRF